MSNDYEWKIVEEYIEFVNTNCVLNLTNGNIYEPHDTIKIHGDDQKFLIVETRKFVEEFNDWICTKPEYMKYLQEHKSTLHRLLMSVLRSFNVNFIDSSGD
jgi:hypothetical protein